MCPKLPQAQPSQPSSRARTFCKTKTVQCVTDALPHKQIELHLLVEIRALERQRRGQALLGRCLRLSARLGARSVHLGRLARLARRSTLWCMLAVSAKLTTACPRLPICVALKTG